MKERLLIILFVFANIVVYGQQPLTNSRTSSLYTYIYRLTDRSMALLYAAKPKTIDDKILGTPVDSFLTGRPGVRQLPPGNYIKVLAHGNHLPYTILQRHSVYLKLLQSTGDVRFLLLDTAGHEVTDGQVTVRGRAIDLDAAVQLYHFRHTKKDTLIQAAYGGVTNFFNINEQKNWGYRVPKVGWFKKLLTWFKKPEKRSSYSRRYDPPPVNPGYMVFNKPKYRPGDTVKIKAFILKKHSKKPVDDQRILVRLRDGYRDNGKIIGEATAYRKGGFTFEFKLVDSLDLRLDRDYNISLETLKSKKYDLDEYDGDEEDEDYLARRTVYQQGNFRYEDYELSVNKFTVRADKTEHSPGLPASLYFRASDDNDLNVMDGRVEVTLMTNSVTNYTGHQVFVADTLWHHTMPLDAVGETKLTVPDSIFPHARVSYRADIVLLNSNNERHEENKYLTYIDQPGAITHQLDADTLKIDYLWMGKTSSTTALLIKKNEQNDTISVSKIQLPLKVVLEPEVANYVVKADNLTDIIDVDKFPIMLNVDGYHTPDSLFVTVTNPRRVPYWYTIYNGNRVMDTGKGTAAGPVYNKPFSGGDGVSVLLNYFYAGKIQAYELAIPMQEKYLRITTNQPQAVYPGQQANISITVKDYKGNPVPNVDLTAYGLTAKFQNYQMPFITYMGKVYEGRQGIKPLFIKQLKANGSLDLNWQRWSKQMGLDSIVYYQFTHPRDVFRVEETLPDTITQIAPFVVNKGDIEPVHILYIDGKPVYFSQTSDVQHYSFAVKPGLHNVRFRTLNRDILLNDVKVQRGKKLILSVNADTTNNKIALIHPLPDTLVNYEADLINKYLISIVPNFGGRMMTLTQDDRHFMFEPNWHSDNYDYLYQRQRNPQLMLAGPLVTNYLNLKVPGKAERDFLTEPGYSFQFEPGLIKQKSLEVKYPFSKFLLNIKGDTSYRQYALTQTAVDSTWRNYLDNRNHTVSLFNNPYTQPQGNGGLTIEVGKLKNGAKPFVTSIILYKYDDPDYVHIYPGANTDLGYLVAGKYRILYLFKGNTYFIQDSIRIKPNGRNFYATGEITTKPADSISLKIAKLIDDHMLYDYNNKTDVQLSKEIFNDKYLDLTSLTEEVTGYVFGLNDKEPLPGVTITIRGTHTGTVTDRNGYFKLKVPKNGRLVISYIGYLAQEEAIRTGTSMRIYMKESSNNLNEVVVVGYGSVSKRDMTGSVTTMMSGLQGRVAGLMVRGDGSITTMGKQITKVRLNGKDFAGAAADQVLQNLPADIIEKVEMVDDYGDQSSMLGKIMVISTKPNPFAQADASMLTNQTFRKNFSDYAYWQPQLTTDAEGKASFKVTFPDDITNWRTFVIGMTGNKQTGTAEGSIKAYKPLSANFTSPLFAVKGDVLKPVGKVLNYTTDTVNIKRTFKYNNGIPDERQATIKNSLIDTFKVIADGRDSLHFEYTVKKADGYFDGEQRSIPLFEQGSLETKGTFAALDKDRTITIQLDPKLKEGTFRAEASVLPVLLNETEHLRNYEYLCNEQLASKLIGLLAEKKIKKYLGEPFKYDKNIDEIIKKLQESRSTKGTWGWWKDTDEELWISLHVVEALLEAEAQGVKTSLDKQKLTDYLLYQSGAYHGEDKLTVMSLLKKLGAKTDYEAIVKAYEKELDKRYPPSTYNQLRLMNAQQQAGLHFNRDSLMKWMHQTMFGNVYWGDDNYSFFNNSVEVSLQAYQLLKADGKYPELLAKLRNYFLEQRRTGYWRNTYESAQILETILPDLLVDGKKPEASVITLTGAKDETVTKFPYTTTLAGGSTLTVNKTGTMPVYVTAYQKFWNPAPEKVSKDFTVNTTFRKNGQSVTKAKGGETITLEAEVIARADADYVMVEIPIPAGCSYLDKSQAYGNGEVHREYFKNKVSIFCRKLTQGRHTFTITLTPRYGGNYHVNPAKAEMMYFPVFYGREGMKVFGVE